MIASQKRKTTRNRVLFFSFLLTVLAKKRERSPDSDRELKSKKHKEIEHEELPKEHKKSKEREVRTIHFFPLNFDKEREKRDLELLSKIKLKKKNDAEVFSLPNHFLLLGTYFN